MASHDIPENIKNSDLEYCIDEYVRLVEYRQILRERWFEGLTHDQLAERHHLSDTYIKKILYDVGDKILLRAAEM